MNARQKAAPDYGLARSKDGHVHVKGPRDTWKLSPTEARQAAKAISELADQIEPDSRADSGFGLTRRHGKVLVKSGAGTWALSPEEAWKASLAITKAADEIDANSRPSLRPGGARLDAAREKLALEDQHLTTMLSRLDGG